MTNIHWLNPVSGDFNTGTNWSGGVVPGSTDNAILSADGGTPYTVTDTFGASQTVNSIQTAKNATLVTHVYGDFSATAGTGTGVNAGTISQESNFYFGGTMDNTGTIDVGAHRLLGFGNSTLSGGGQVSVNFSGTVGAYGAGVLTNVDNTISGSGFVTGSLVNEAKGVIDATGAFGRYASYALALKGSTTNFGLIESTSITTPPTGLQINTTVDQSGGGTILAANGAYVLLDNADIIGGTLKSAGTGAIDITSNNNVLDGSASPLIDKATINVSGGYTAGAYEVTLKGAIANSGVINVAGARETGIQTNLIVDATGVTLTGAGSINLVAGVATAHGAGTAEIIGAGAGSVLTNVDNTLAGTGAIGTGGLTVINQGVIDANAAKALFVFGPVVNSGLIEATIGALVVAGTVTNAGGTIEANGGRVLLNGVDIAGGSVEAVGSSQLATRGLGTVLDGTGGAVTLAGTLTVAAATNITLEGAIDNSGRIAVNASTAHPGNTDLIVGAAGATLSGGGQVVLSALADNRIYGVAKTATLDNVDNRISGAGLLGNGVLTLVNGAKGVIVANGAVGLTLNTGSNTIDNAGVIYTSRSGQMVIDSAIANTGVLSTHGGLLKVNGAVSGAGRAVITGGVLDFTSSFSQNVQFGAAGTLELAQSQVYDGKLVGFSQTGGNSLDLANIAGGVTSYSGTTTRGVLTVTGGGVTASFTLIGDYLGTTFTASSDGHGGTKVIDTGGAGAPVAPATQAHAFIAAMAGLAGVGGAAVHTSATWSERAPMLVRPHTMIA